MQYIFIFLWSLLFIVPGIIAAYRYRFALYNLCENPEMGVMEALNMSKAQTLGFKGQLFVLDLSFIGWYLLSGLTAGILLIWLVSLSDADGHGLLPADQEHQGHRVLPGAAPPGG